MLSAFLPIALGDVSAERDIHANAGHGPESSTGALAAYIRTSCGHVWLDEHVLSRGYRFYPWISDEIPHFFNRRTTVADTRIAITLQAGISLDGEDPFDGCPNHSTARSILADDDFAPTLWSARVTVNGELFDVTDVAAPVFIARRPAEFRAIAEELVSLGVLPAASCPLCSR